MDAARFPRSAVATYRFINGRYFINYTYAGTPGEAWMEIIPHIRALEAADPEAGAYRFVGWEVIEPHFDEPGMVSILSGPIGGES
jgi:hypothetical protein